VSQQQVPFTSIPAQVINLDDARYRKVTTNIRAFTWHDLSQAQPLLYPQEVLNSFASGLPLSDRHTIYRIDDETPVYVPAALLIRALFLGTKLLNSHLFTPGVVDLLGTVRMNGDGIHLMASKLINRPNMTGRIARLIAWMLMNEDGRKAHASVLHHARKGLINMDLPNISVGGWVRGIEVGVGLLAFELHGIDISYPLAHERIICHVGGKTKAFQSYEPPKKGPWVLEKRQLRM
jgi:hypothetical protein